MGLAETQRLLAQLYTDGALRQRFFADPASVGGEWSLSPDDLRSLSGLSSSQVDLFSRSLQAKRLGEIRKLLPQTCRALGLHTVPLFRQFGDTFVPSGLHKHRVDALAFAAFLETLPPEEIALPLWLPDLLRYEAAWLTASDPNCRLHFCKTRRDIFAVRQGLNAEKVPEMTRRPALALWWRFSPSGRLRHKIL